MNRTKHIVRRDREVYATSSSLASAGRHVDESVRQQRVSHLPLFTHLTRHIDRFLLGIAKYSDVLSVCPAGSPLPHSPTPLPP